MSYQTLDFVADAYIPFLLVCVIACSAHRAGKAQKPWLDGLKRAGKLAVLVCLVYGMWLLDYALKLWPAIGLDYSTHTALAIAFTFALWRCSARSDLRWLWPMGLLGYTALMRYQQYHTWTDMIVTGLFMAVAIAAVALTLKCSTKAK